VSYAFEFFAHVLEISRSMDVNVVEKMAGELVSLRERGGRLFLLGVGGSAGNCSHAVNDFRKLCGIETYRHSHQGGRMNDFSA
jgi:D-sedoheptulose 7-phosphate isomerase